MDDLNEFVGALRMHNWYVVLGLLLTFFIQFVRKHPWTQLGWQKIPEGLRFLPPVVFAYAVGFVTAYTEHQPFAVAAIAGLGGIFEIGLPAMGFAAALKESPLPWDGGAGGTAALLLLFFVPASLTSCRGPKSADAVRTELAAYDAAAIALEKVDALVAADPQIQACGGTAAPSGAAGVAGAAGAPAAGAGGAPSAAVPKICALEASIVRTRSELNIVRNELVNGSTETTGEHITNVLELTKDLLDEATADGVAVPPLITSSVTTALSLLKGE